MATLTAPFVSWDKSWLIGVHEIDAQHKRLVELLNQLHHAMSEGKGKDVLGGILESLVAYTKAHFKAEESMLEQSGYPEIVQHKFEHAELTRKVLDFQKKFEAGGFGMSIELMEFLRTWLKGHILGTDIKYVALLHSRGIK